MKINLLINFFLKYWSPIISSLALFISLITSWYVWRSNHQEPEITTVWIHQVSNQYNICLNIINQSARPICIHDVSLVINSQKFKITDFKVWLSNPAGHPELKSYSDELPLNLPPYFGTKVIYAFQHVTEEFKNTAVIELKYDQQKVIYCTFTPRQLISKEEYSWRLDYRNYNS